MNIYQKVSELRIDLQNGEMKKSGHNKHSNYDYFELSDMLPKINRLEQKHGLCSFVSFSEDIAALTIVDADKPENTITVTSPMSTAKLPACHEVQNLGAVQTYIRRYLYTAAYGIVECDALDGAMGADKTASKSPAQQPNTKPQTPLTHDFDDNPTSEMIQILYRIAKERGYDARKVAASILKKFECTPKDMTLDQYKMMLDGYNSLPKIA